VDKNLDLPVKSVPLGAGGGSAAYGDPAAVRRNGALSETSNLIVVQAKGCANAKRMVSFGFWNILQGAPEGPLSAFSGLFTRHAPFVEAREKKNWCFR